MIPAVSLAGATYAFPREARSVADLERDGLLESDAATMRAFGFDRVFVAADETPFDLARDAASRLLAEQGVDPATVDALIVGGATGPMAFASGRDAADGAAALCTRGRFRYPGTRLQFELGLNNATVVAIDQLACTTLLAAVRLARSMIVADGCRQVLCVASEFYPSRAGREAIFNCTSDAACAVLVRAADAGAPCRVVAGSTVTKGYYWDVEAQRNEIVASYFPTAAAVMSRTVAEAGWRAGDVDWVLPHNVSRRSWDILMGLAKLPRARLWSTNIARRGHTLAGDVFINLRDALDAGDLRPGQRVLLFSYGFGAHWTGLAVEV